MNTYDKIQLDKALAMRIIHTEDALVEVTALLETLAIELHKHTPHSDLCRKANELVFSINSEINN